MTTTFTMRIDDTLKGEAEEAANDPNEPRCTDPTKLREFLLS